MKKQAVGVFLISIASLQSIQAQTLSDTLQGFEIKSAKNNYSDSKIQDYAPGQKKTSFDSAALSRYRLQTLSGMLSRQTPVFIKSYGFNGLATLNMRGSSAAQTQVYWNGIPIQNSAQGLTDISLVPVSLLQQIDIVYGGSSALWGSGNVGGALFLRTEDPAFDSVRKLSYELAGAAGSFGQRQYGGKIRMTTGSFFASAALVRQEGKNDFSYTDDFGTKKKNVHSALSSHAVMLQTAYRADRQNIFRTALWLQEDRREIPPALFETISLKKREDNTIRWMASWENSTGFYARLAFLNERMQYEDVAVQLQSKMRTHTYFAEIGYSREYRRHKLLFFIPLQYATIPDYDIPARQSRYAAALAYRYALPGNRLQAAINLRTEQIADKTIFLPGWNISYAPRKWILLRANMQRSYRAPTLNEQYYTPGGNASLKPEHGWSTDIGYTITQTWSPSLTLQQDISVFSRTMNDWILWMGGAIWTPHNIAKVRSRGIEAENVFYYTAGKWKIHTGFQAAYIQASTLESHIPGDQSKGKQIPYTPRWNGQVRAGVSSGHFYLHAHVAYTSSRFVNTDETDAIAAYTIAGMETGYVLRMHSYGMQLNLQIHNLFNERYMVVASRIMPGSNFMAGIRLFKH